MLYLILASAFLAIAGAVCFIALDNRYDFLSDILQVCAGILTVVGMIALVVCIPLGISWRGSEVKAQLINREYGTNYTQEEVFYASSVIDVIRELDRKRYEVNGDLRRQRDPQRDRHQSQPE